MKKKGKLKKYVMLISGIFISAFAFNLFFLSNDLAAFGVSGLSIVVRALFDIDVSYFVLITNIILIIASYILLDKHSTNRSIIGSLLFPVFMKLTFPLANLIDISNLDMIIICIVGGVLVGFGSGLIYREGYSTGGTDIVDLILSKYLKIPMGVAIIIGDGAVVLFGGFVFGIEKMMYSLVTLFLVSRISNRVLFGLYNMKTFYILSDKDEQIKSYLIETLKYDVTFIDADGKNNNNVLMTAVKTKDYAMLKNKIHEIDGNAIVTIINSYEVLNNDLSISKKTS